VKDADLVLMQSLAVFLRAYRAQAALVAEQRGWSPVIALHATDADTRVRLDLADGVVMRADRDDGARAPTLVVSAGLRVLSDVLELRCDPNEPYLFGELTVSGPEADFLRLDYIATRLGGRC
jgi:hypothetical protein